MPTSQPEKGIRGTYRARYGLDIGRCKGIDDSHDPSILPDENLVQGINMRVHDGIGVSRGGQQKVLGAGNGLAGCVYGGIEVEGSGGGGGGSFYVRANNLLYTYTPPADLVLCSDPSVGIYGVNVLTSAYAARTFAKFNGTTVVAINDYYPDFLIVELVAPASQDSGIKIKTKELLRIPHPGGSNPILSLCSMASLPPSDPSNSSETLFLGVVGVGANGNGGVYAWNPTDGLILLADDFPIGYPVYVFAAHGTIWASALNDIRRLNGWTHGKTLNQATWTSLTGLPSLIDLKCAETYKGITYVGGIDNFDPDNKSIFKIVDPLGASPSLSLAHTPTLGGLSHSLQIIDMAVSEGRLVYVWGSSDPDDDADHGDVVGRLTVTDGSPEWLDSYYLVDVAETAGQGGRRVYADSGNAFYYLRVGGWAYDDEGQGVIRRFKGIWSVYFTSDTLVFSDIILR